MLKSLIGFTFFLLLITIARAGVPVDIVFDIDLTLATKISEAVNGDLMQDTLHPEKRRFSISFQEPVLDATNKPVLTPEGLPKSKAISESYRHYDDLLEILQDLKSLQEKGLVRVSFFSGGHELRNKELLKKLILPDGTSALELANSRVYSRSDMKPTGLGPEARVRERFKKDLTIINPNLEDVVIIDDIKQFVPDSQKANMFWIGEDFPYADRVWEKDYIPPSADMLYREKNKYKWIRSYLFEALERRFKEGGTLSGIIQEMTANGAKTPFTPGEEVHFKNVFCLKRSLQNLLKH